MMDRVGEIMDRPNVTYLRMIPAFICLFPLFHASGQPAPRSPRQWDIELRLAATGRYSVRDADAACAGEFLYEATWSGSMEKDDADFLLYHSGAETLRWEAHEEVSSGGEQRVLTEKDFDDRPEFRMNYVLNENGVLRFDFIVDGFPVPRGGSGEKFDLILPASKKEGGGASPYGYDDFVTKGSNEVVIEEKIVLSGAAERTFHWEFMRYQPSSGPATPTVLFNSHNAEVKIAITPVHYKE